MHTEFRDRHAEGQAAVEALLVIPFLLTLVILAENSARIMLLKEHAIVTTRVAAWNAAHYPDVPCSLTLPERTFGGSFLVTRCAEGREDANRFLGDMQRKGGRQVVGISGDVGSNTHPYLTDAVGRGLYWPFGVERLLPVTIRTHHVLSANRAWEREQLPIGYDRYLKRKLGRGSLFPNLFPRAP